MLTKSEVFLIKKTLEVYLNSAKGFIGNDSDDILNNAWEDAIDFVSHENLLGLKLLEKFLCMNEENVRDIFLASFTEKLFEIINTNLVNIPKLICYNKI